MVGDGRMNGGNDNDDDDDGGGMIHGKEGCSETQRQMDGLLCWVCLRDRICRSRGK